MKLRLLLIFVSALILMGSCRIVNLSDNAKHKHLNKVAVDSPDAIIEHADLTKADREDIASTLNSTDIQEEIEVITTEDHSSSISEETAEIKPKASHRNSIQKAVKLLNVFSPTHKSLAAFSPDNKTYLDPATILIWALIAVLILALLAVIIPDILNILITLLFVVLIVVLILYLANNL